MNDTPELDKMAVAHVADRPITLAEVFYAMKLMDGLGPLLEAVEALIASRLAEVRGVTLSDEELQDAADALRAQAGLHSMSDTHDWLKSRALTIDDLEARAFLEGCRSRLKRAVTDDSLAAYRASHARSFDLARLRRIAVSSEEEAQRLLEVLATEPSRFTELAREQSLDDDETRESGGRVGLVARGAMIPAVNAAIFGARPGDIVGPLRVGRRYYLVLVEEIVPSDGNPECDEVLRELMFEDWFSDQFGSDGVDVAPLRRLLDPATLRHSASLAHSEAES